MHTKIETLSSHLGAFSLAITGSLRVDESFFEAFKVALSNYHPLSSAEHVACNSNCFLVASQHKFLYSHKGGSGILSLD